MGQVAEVPVRFLQRRLRDEAVGVITGLVRRAPPRPGVVATRI